jgi:hypothetical protein
MASGPVLMFCAPGLVFVGTEGVGSRFEVLRSRTHFRQCRVRRISFSCFVLPDSFSAVPRASGSVFIFCASGVVFSSTEGVGSRFHVLFARSRFQQYRGREVPFSCFAISDSFSASGPVVIFCAPGIVFGGTEGVGSRIDVWRVRTHFLRYRGRQFPFSCFARTDSFSAVPRTSGPVFMFCALELIFGGVECVGSRFHVLRARSRFQQYRGRGVPFSCFAIPDSFSRVPRASGPVFIF